MRNKRIMVTLVFGFYLYETLIITLHKKLSLPLRISSVNVTKSAGEDEQ